MLKNDKAIFFTYNTKLFVIIFFDFDTKIMLNAVFIVFETNIPI